MRIKHAMATPLHHVGLQLWRGALLLAAAVVARRSELKDRRVVELGGGVGLVSIVAAKCGQCGMVRLTDVDDEAVLALARENVALNGCTADAVEVAALDWARFPEAAGGTEVDVILAADVIYDDTITDAFFATLRRLLWPRGRDPDGEEEASGSGPGRAGGGAGGGAYCLLALEKRINFSLAHMATVAHGYDRFQAQLEDRRTPWPLSGRKVPLESVPPSLLGQPPSWRGDDLELWEIRPLVPSKTNKEGKRESASGRGFGIVEKHG